MPTISRAQGYRAFFYSLDRSEPPHVHVEHGDKVAKSWLDPVELAITHRIIFRESWDEHFSRQG